MFLDRVYLYIPLILCLMITSLADMYGGKKTAAREAAIIGQCCFPYTNEAGVGTGHGKILVSDGPLPGVQYRMIPQGLPSTAWGLDARLTPSSDTESAVLSALAGSRKNQSIYVTLDNIPGNRIEGSSLGAASELACLGFITEVAVTGYTNNFGDGPAELDILAVDDVWAKTQYALQNNLRLIIPLANVTSDERLRDAYLRGSISTMASLMRGDKLQKICSASGIGTAIWVLARLDPSVIRQLPKGVPGHAADSYRGV
jgi:hypothetical protein